MSRSTMRWTLALAAILAAVGLRAISRGANDDAGAGDKGQGTGEKKTAVAVDASGLTAVEKALDKQVSVKLKDVPLKEVAAYLADLAGVNVLLDAKPLAEAGIKDDLKINFERTDVGLRTAIRELLAAYDLGYVIPEDNVLLITSAAAANEHLITRIYNVEDILPPSGPPNEFTEFPARVDAAPLGELLTTSVQPSTWVAAGGFGSGGIGTISIHGGCLVITHNSEGHREGAEFFAALRKIRADEKAGKTPTMVLVGSTPAEDKIRQRLERRQDFDFHAMPVLGVIEYLRGQGIPALIAPRQLTDAGVTVETPLSFKAKQVSLKYALRTMLGEHELAYIVRDDALMIGSGVAAKDHVRLGIYPVGDLLDAKPGDREGDLGFLSLEELIFSAVSPTLWTDIGGPPPISHYANPVVLAIDQTEEIHEQIADLLQRLRAARRTSHDSDAAKPPIAAKNAMVVRVHLVLNKDNAAMDQYIAVIRSLIEPKSWSDGAGYLGKVPGAIVVRNTPAAQARIRNLLDQLDSATTVGGYGKPAAASAPAPVATPAAGSAPTPAGTPPTTTNPAAPGATIPSETKPPVVTKPKP